MSEVLITYAPIISLFLRLFSFLITTLFIIPLMVQQAKVKNGLRIFRWLLLLYGVLITISNLLSSFILFNLIQDGLIQRTLNAHLQLINASVFFATSLIGYAMYHYQFNKENVRRHEKIDKLEAQEKKMKGVKAWKR